jgi:SAM-dependent methyltransferase/3-polyprenyl-4-hydroxybenzoate decarboxylase
MPAMTQADDTPLRRSDSLRAYDVGDRLVLVEPDGNGCELTGDSAMLARFVLTELVAPHTSAEVVAAVARETGAPVEHPQVVHQLLDLLHSVGAIAPVTTRRRLAVRPHRPRRLALGLTGAVGTMTSPLLVSALQRAGFDVRVMTTANARRFVTAEALQALTHHPVVERLWPVVERLWPVVERLWPDVQGPAVPHLDLARWADAVVVCPASATTISRLATADHDCVVSATALATSAPVLVVPSMNPAMYHGAGVQRNLQQLAADGMHVAHPGRGLEMADAPGQRTPQLGGAVPPDAVVALVEAMLRARAAGQGHAVLPRSAADWDALYRSHPRDADVPWQATTLDEDLARALDEGAPPQSAVLDLGTGLGPVAIACAKRGHRVVATDLSPLALQRAQAAAGDAPIVWVHDDIADTRILGRFDVVVDRGCLHLLDDDARRGYARSLARLTAPGGLVLLKTLAGPEATRRGARPDTTETIEVLLGDAFAIEAEAETTLPGPHDAPAARLFTLRRR